MAAPKGNKNAEGNIGGKSLNDRKLAASVRTLALQEIQKVLEMDDCEYKRQVVLKLAPSLLPRLNEHTGKDGEDLPTPILAHLHVSTHDGDNQDSQSQEAD